MRCQHVYDYFYVIPGLNPLGLRYCKEKKCVQCVCVRYYLGFVDWSHDAGLGLFLTLVRQRG